MLNWLFKPKKAKPASNDDLVEKLVWLPIGDPQNPFQEEVLDCREVARNFLSVTKDEGMAATFSAIRGEDGRQYIDKLPENAVSFDCNFSFPFNGGPRVDGPLFIARAMEQKWDFYQFGNRLYIRRSWTGALTHVAECQFTDSAVRFHRIHCEPNRIYNDGDYGIVHVHFLITTHLMQRLKPFPIPPKIPRDAKQFIAFEGFKSYGRFAQFATFSRNTS